MTLRRALSATGWALGIIALLIVCYLVNVQAEVWLCVNDKLHSLFPKPDTADIWSGCVRLHRAFPFSFLP